MPLDPVLLEILGHKLRAITEEMAIARSRTARTTYVREAADFGTPRPHHRPGVRQTKCGGELRGRPI